MEFVTLILITYVAVIGTVSLFKRKKVISVSPAPSKELSEGPGSPDHILVKTWIEAENYPGIPAWKWKCSCGGSGSATNAKAGDNLGSEANAIERFKDHARLYKEANGNTWKDKHDEVQAKFDAFIKNCYCKDTLHHQLERP